MFISLISFLFTFHKTPLHTSVKWKSFQFPACLFSRIFRTCNSLCLEHPSLFCMFDKTPTSSVCLSLDSFSFRKLPLPSPDGRSASPPITPPASCTVCASPPSDHIIIDGSACLSPRLDGSRSRTEFILTTT